MITKLDIEMFHHESWKPIYFGVKRSKVEATGHKKTVLASFVALCECWLLLVMTVFVLVFDNETPTGIFTNNNRFAQWKTLLTYIPATHGARLLDRQN